MKTTFIVLTIHLFLLVFCLGFGCTNKPKKESFIVQVAFEPEFYNENRIDTVLFSKPWTNTYQIKDLKQYVGQESIRVKSGEVTISANSFFERTYSKTIQLKSDTVIVFSKKDFPKSFVSTKRWPDKLVLNKIDTIVIHCFNSGCYTSDEFASKRKIIAYKNDKNFIVNYSDLPSGEAEQKSSYKTQTIDDFDVFLNEFYSSIQIDKTNFMSTANFYCYMRVGNDIFQIVDPDFTKWKHYDKLITRVENKPS